MRSKNQCENWVEKTARAGSWLPRTLRAEPPGRGKGRGFGYLLTCYKEHRETDDGKRANSFSWSRWTLITERKLQRGGRSGGGHAAGTDLHAPPRQNLQTFGFLSDFCRFENSATIVFFLNPPRKQSQWVLGAPLAAPSCLSMILASI